MKAISDPEYRELLRVLVKTRQSAGLTQQTIAERLGRPQSFVAKFEGGERRLDVSDFIAVARALRVDPCVLLRAAYKS